jgi:anti-sigma regulatory factor (Ser/Thr protein kinase)
MDMGGTASLPAVPAIDLPYDASSPKVARRWAANTLKEVVNDDMAYDITVCLSELVTNSLEHTTPTIDRKDLTCKIHVRSLPSVTLIHVECIDPGSQQSTPNRRPASDTDINGRGLKIVESLADEWGHDDTVPGQRTTWFIVVVGRLAA